MLSKPQLLALCHDLSLTNKAKRVVESARSSPPSRGLQPSTKSLTARYPSRKMGQVIQAQNHKLELPAIYQYEHDPDVLEYWDRPPAVPLQYQGTSGRTVAVLHVPNFLVIRRNEIAYEEWRTELELEKLADRMPNRYIRDDERGWSCPPAQHYTAPLGLHYRLRSSSELDPIFTRNVEFLEDYWVPEAAEPDPETIERAQSLAQSNPGVTLETLFLRLPHATADDIFQMIAREDLFVDLQAAPLADRRVVKVFANAQVASATLAFATSQLTGENRRLSRLPGTRFAWDSQVWMIANSGDTRVTLIPSIGDPIGLEWTVFEQLEQTGAFALIKETTHRASSVPGGNLLTQASEEELAVANHRFSIIAPRVRDGLRGNAAPIPEGVAPRTYWRWIGQWKEAQQRFGAGYLGLLPRTKRRGNRTQRLAPRASALMMQFIEEKYEPFKQQSKAQVYQAYRRACEQAEVKPGSYSTFVEKIGQRSAHASTKKRRGARAAYKYEPWHWELATKTPRHGDRPWHIGHIDHTLLDIELVCSATGQNLGRPWLTLLMDAFSRRIGAVYLSFDPPSYRSCMMVLRVCVRRHGWLPQSIISDGGAEFASTYYETLLARYGRMKKTRPGSKPRFGSVIERLFGTAHSQFIYNLQGNTQLTRAVRLVTKVNNPRTLAVWTLPMFHARLCQWAYEIYDGTPHPALHQSPRDAYLTGMTQYGWREHRKISYDQEFRVLSLPSTRRGEAKIREGAGVKINQLWYWSESFRTAGVEGTTVAVRYDPMDASLAYAYVGGRWHKCRSEHPVWFTARSEKELQLATAELRQRNRQHGRNYNITGRRLADFLAAAEDDEKLLLQRRRDAEQRRVLAASEQDPPAQLLSAAILPPIVLDEADIVECPVEPMP